MTPEPSTTQQNQLEDSEWRRFPAHEQLFAAENPPVLEVMQRNFRRLEIIAREGTAAEQTRARTVLTAYTHVFDLLRSIRELHSRVVAT